MGSGASLVCFYLSVSMMIVEDRLHGNVERYNPIIVLINLTRNDQSPEVYNRDS